MSLKPAVKRPVQAEIDRDRREEMVERVLTATKIDPAEKVLVKLTVSRAGPQAGWAVGTECQTRADRACRMFAAGEAAPVDEKSKLIFEAIGADNMKNEEMP